MASWMMHFRVAQAMPEGRCPWVRAEAGLTEAFVLGNVAPDSGIPTPDGGYCPDKTVSHFMRCFADAPEGQNPERCDPHWLAEAWLEPALERRDGMAAAFFLGYLCHLMTDNAWVRDFIYPAKVRFGHLRLVDGAETPEGVARFYAFLKRDWYDMDFLYLRRHSEPAAYRLFLEAERLTNTFLPFFPADAFERKRAEIGSFYRSGVEGVEEREVYISEEEAVAFIERVASEIAETFGIYLQRAEELFAPAAL